MSSVQFSGVFPILATPFNPDESLDLDSFERVVRFMADTEVNGVTILGVLGEANRLNDTERCRLIDSAIEAADDRIPVIVGASHSSTAASVELARTAVSLGAAGIMLTPSREPVPNPEAIFAYFSQVASRADTPVVLQDHPASTQVHMSVELIGRMVAQIPQIACLKAEATPSPARVAALVAATEERPIPILTGLGALYGFFELEAGASGFMTGFAFPEVLLALVDAMGREDLDGAFQLYQRFLPLIVFEQQPGVAIRKEIYRRRGWIDCAKVRHPGADLSPKAAAQLQLVLDQVVGGADIRLRLPI